VDIVHKWNNIIPGYERKYGKNNEARSAVVLLRLRFVIQGKSRRLVGKHESAPPGSIHFLGFGEAGWSMIGTIICRRNLA